MSATYVLFHSDCYDGFGAAWAAWRALGDSATYLPVKHGDPCPDLPDGATVYIVDFSYPRDVLEGLRERMARLVILDHHKSAAEALEGFPDATFDMNHSGAVLTWRHFHGHAPLPWLLAYVEDHDLWRHGLPRSREVFAALQAEEMDFGRWTDFERALATNFVDVAHCGATVLRFKARQVRRICDKARIGFVGGQPVPIVNATAFWSEVGDELLRRNPQAPFVASYYEREDGRRVWSLRSRPGYDVSRIAVACGGGGHPQAAGFTEGVGAHA